MAWTFNGETLTVVEWGNRLGIKPTTLLARVKDQGRTIEEALTMPLDKRTVPNETCLADGKKKAGHRRVECPECYRIRNIRTYENAKAKRKRLTDDWNF